MSTGRFFHHNFIVSLLLCMIALLTLNACSKDDGKHTASEGGSGKKRTTLDSCPMPDASGSRVWTSTDQTVQVDASHTEDGYVLVSYTGSADKVQVQVTNPDGSRNPYPLELGSYRGIPLTGGNGDYLLQVLIHVSGKKYAIGLSESFTVQLKDEFAPYLYPNQYCDYSPDSDCVLKGREISRNSTDDLNYIGNVYQFVIQNISYDEDFAKNIPVNYLPNPDTTMSVKKGICLDYASLTTAMLRSQGIPTKLEVGYSDDVYHAWVSVWTEETGWIDNAIEFTGDWTRVDPTLGANNKSSSVKKYIGDGSHYTLDYNY